MKNLIFGIILIGILFVGFSYYQSTKKTSTPPVSESESNTNIPSENTIAPTTAEDTELQAGGSSYSDPDGVFSMLYPNDYTIDSQGEGQYTRIYKRGATQQGQTEMYDGVLMVFEVLNLEGQTLEQWVDSYIKTLTADGTITIIKPKKAVTVKGYSGFTFETQGLGSSTYTIIQKDSNSGNAVNITYTVNDPEKVGYQAEVDAVLRNITLLK